MAHYVILANFQSQDSLDMTQAPSMIRQVREAIEQSGCTPGTMLATMGFYDALITFEATDNAAALGVTLRIGAMDFRTTTFPAFSPEDVEQLAAAHS